jgi:hypothetical protein
MPVVQRHFRLTQRESTSNRVLLSMSDNPELVHLHWFLGRLRIAGADKINYKRRDSVHLQNCIALAFSEMFHVRPRTEKSARGHVFQRRFIPFRSHSYCSRAADHRNVFCPSTES